VVNNWSNPFELLSVHRSEFSQHPLPSIRKQYLHLTTVLRGGLPGNQAFLNKSVNQSNGAVVLDYQVLRQVIDRYRLLRGVAPYRKHRLVVLAG
jgi:hypothetical protein